MFELCDVEFVQESLEPMCISFCPSEKNLNVNGKIHGGVLFTLCDDIIGRYVTHIGRKGAASDANIHYYRPAEAGERLYATLHERKTGKMLGVYQVELTNEAGKLIADAMFTVAFLQM